MKQLKEGDAAPQFKGQDQNEALVKLSDFIGKKLVLFFYPKDMTPGCTSEACNLRDNYKELLDEGYSILGVSPDSPKLHKRFIEKNSLPFPLIADEEKIILQQYGVWGEKKMYGRSYLGVLRTTFIIDEKGIVSKIIDKVKTRDHSSQILSQN